MKFKCYRESTCWSEQYRNLYGDDLINKAIECQNQTVEAETLNDLIKAVYKSRQVEYKEINIDFYKKQLAIQDMDVHPFTVNKHSGNYKACSFKDKECFNKDKSFEKDFYIDRKKCLDISKDINLIDLKTMAEMKKSFDIKVNFTNKLIIFNNTIG